ncbi:MAG: histidine kinase N-terminal 7TM domain-containing protein [Myxococcota bacterium]|jgi:hypothetical protein
MNDAGPHFLYLGSLLFAAIVMAILVLHATRYRGLLAWSFGWMAGVAGWVALSEIVSALSPTEGMAILWLRFRFSGVILGPVLGLALALVYSGRGGWLTRSRLAILLLIPAITLLTIWIPGLRGCTLELFVRREGGLWMIYSPTPETGAWFKVHLVYSLAVCMAGLGLVTGIAAATFSRHSYQALALVLGALCPMLGAIIFVVWPDLPVNPTSQGIALGGIAWAFAIFRYRLMDVVPVARDSLFERGLDDGDRHLVAGAVHQPVVCAVSGC